MPYKYIALFVYFLISQIIATWFKFISTGAFTAPSKGGAVMAFFLAMGAALAWTKTYTKILDLE